MGAERIKYGWWIVSDDGVRKFIASGALVANRDTDFVLNEYVSFICCKNKNPGELTKEESERMKNLYNWMHDGDPQPITRVVISERPVYFADLSSRPERNHEQSKKVFDELLESLRAKEGKKN